METNLLECGICQSRLSKPKCLPCMHSFCSMCIKSYIVQNVSEEDEACSHFACPTCCFTVAIPAKNLPKDTWSSLLPDNQLVVILTERNAFEEAKFCDPCSRGKSEATAASWCADCGEALCKQCTDYHGRVKVLMEHRVKSMESMKSKPTKTAEMGELCKVHPGKLVEAMCYDHDVLCCLDCVTYIHKKCRKVESLEEASTGYKSENKFQTVIDRLKWIENKARDVIGSRSENMEELEKQKIDILSDITRIRADICLHLGKLEEDLNTELSTMHDTLRAKLEIERKNFENLRKTTSNGIQILDSSARLGTEEHLFVTTHKLRKVVEEYEEYTKSESRNIKRYQYSLSINEIVNKFCENVLSIAKTNIVNSPTNLLPAHIKDMRLIEVADIKGKTPSDAENCWITGGLFLPCSRMVFADYRNKKLKCFDSSYELISETILLGKPWDVCFVRDGLLMVTIPDDSLLLNIIMDNNGKLAVEGEPIDVEVGCYGVNILNQKLCVACSNEIRIMTVDGVVEKTVSMDDRGTRYAQVVDNERILFTSQTSLICINFDGKIMFRYKDPELRSPRGFTLDQEGNIYICGMDSNNIHLVTSSGTFHRLLLTAKEGIRSPYTIKFDTNTTRLFLSQMDSDCIKVYKLVTDW